MGSVTPPVFSQPPLPAAGTSVTPPVFSAPPLPVPLRRRENTFSDGPPPGVDVGASANSLQVAREGTSKFSAPAPVGASALDSSSAQSPAAMFQASLAKTSALAG